MNLYHYLYYKIYGFTRKLGNYDNSFSAMLGLTFLVFLNITPLLSIMGVSEFLFKKYKPFFYLFFLMILALNYFIFIFKYKYRAIIVKYKDESKYQKKLGNSLVILYVIVSIIFFIILSH